MEPPAAEMLRSKYRCKMCHKHCLVPCRLPSSVFRQMAEGTYEGKSPNDDIEWDPYSGEALTELGAPFPSTDRDDISETRNSASERIWRFLCRRG